MTSYAVRQIVHYVNGALRPLGLRIARARGRVWNVGRAADHVRTLIDVGCAYGTPELYGVSRGASLFLINPLVEYLPHIERVLARRPGGHEITAVGSKPGELCFNVETDAPTRSSALTRTALTRGAGRIEQRMVPVTTLDRVVESHGLQGPFGLKIDSEGYELEVLRGALATLRRTHFVITESSVERRFEKSYSFLELLDFMDHAGFDFARVLTAHPDANEVIRYLDVLFVNRDARIALGE